MAYQTVFDAAKVGYNWTFTAFGLGFVAIGCMLFTIRNLPRWNLPQWLPQWNRPQPWLRTTPRFNRWFAYVFLGFSLIWTITITYATYSQYSNVQAALKSGHFHVIAGTVTNFKPMPYTGHAMEHFCVERVCFEYSDYVETPGFHNTSSHGGPIQAGLPVRVSYIGNTILRLEVGSGRDG
jgi:hypothetical protein